MTAAKLKGRELHAHLCRSPRYGAQRLPRHVLQRVPRRPRHSRVPHDDRRGPRLAGRPGVVERTPDDPITRPIARSLARAGWLAVELAWPHPPAPTSGGGHLGDRRRDHRMLVPTSETRALNQRNGRCQSRPQPGWRAADQPTDAAGDLATGVWGQARLAAGGLTKTTPCGRGAVEGPPCKSRPIWSSRNWGSSTPARPAVYPVLR